MATSKLSPDNHIVLPTAVRKALQVGPGDEIVFEIMNNSVILKNAARRSPKKPTIEELISKITPDNLPDDHFDDGPMGSEKI